MPNATFVSMMGLDEARVKLTELGYVKSASGDRSLLHGSPASYELYYKPDFAGEIDAQKPAGVGTRFIYCGSQEGIDELSKQAWLERV